MKFTVPSTRSASLNIRKYLLASSSNEYDVILRHFSIHSWHERRRSAVIIPFWSSDVCTSAHLPRQSSRRHSFICQWHAHCASLIFNRDFPAVHTHTHIWFSSIRSTLVEMSSSMTVALSIAQKTVSRYIQSIVFVLGVIGSLLNLLLFSRRRLRSTSCCTCEWWSLVTNIVSIRSVHRFLCLIHCCSELTLDGNHPVALRSDQPDQSVLQHQ